MTLMPTFDVAEPTTAGEAVALKTARADSAYLGGGTDLIPNLRRGLGAPGLLVSLARIPEMQRLEIGDSGLVIGAGVTVETLERSVELAERFAAVAMAAAAIAAPGHRAMATVGGNLCVDTRCVFYNQSEWWRAANGYCLKYGGEVCHVQKKGGRCVAAYSGDLAPALMALGAEVEIETAAGRKRRTLAEIYRDDGKDYLDLVPGSLLVAVHVPAVPGRRSGYLKSRFRRSIDFPLAGVAAALTRDGERISSLAVAITGTNSRPLLLEDTSELAGAALNGGFLDTLSKKIAGSVQPMRTTLVPSLYRRHVAGVLARRLLTELYNHD